MSGTKDTLVREPHARRFGYDAGMTNKSLLWTGITGATLAILCCATPLLVILLGAVGLSALTGYLEQYAYLFRNTHAIRTAIRRITRIVGALKGYSHLDQAKVSATDLHEGIENSSPGENDVSPLWLQARHLAALLKRQRREQRHHLPQVCIR